ncbi:MAG: hypothetical protein IJH00_06390 [Erysipelotrichaceae bacterium]|nr:hypothetical protein [Erysipelotrichaceae bacterium]
MEKEKILENSRLENRGKDFYALQVEANACKIASIVMVLLAFVYYSYEMFTGKGSNPAFYSLITIFNAVMFGYRAIKIEEKRGLSIFASVVWTILTAILILRYFGVI